ncbi:TIGR03936 family radical SAM-associated protein [soil metagenome]
MQQPPPVQRVRIRYTKRSRLRFTSHRDISRAFERAVRRAALPVSYSSGFNPHPRLSYAGAAPTGAASEAEYMEVALAAPCDPETVRGRLDAAMPPGLDVVDAVTARTGALADRLQASSWTMLLGGVSTGASERAVAAFLAADAVQVSRMTKRGLRHFDARASVVSLRAGPAPRAVSGEASDGCAILAAVVRHGEPSVRPDDVLAGLREVAGLESSSAPIVQRLAQGPLDPRDGTVGDPLAADRDTRDS